VAISKTISQVGNEEIEILLQDYLKMVDVLIATLLDLIDPLYKKNSL